MTNYTFLIICEEIHTILNLHDFSLEKIYSLFQESWRFSSLNDKNLLWWWDMVNGEEGLIINVII